MDPLEIVDPAVSVRTHLLPTTGEKKTKVEKPKDDRLKWVAVLSLSLTVAALLGIGTLLMMGRAVKKARDRGTQDDTVVYDEQYANRSVLFAYASGCKEKDIINWDCKYCNMLDGVTFYHIYNKSRLLVYIAYDEIEDQIVVAFRGSSNVDNWLANAMIMMVPYQGVPGATIHAGFYKLWRDISEDVMNGVKELIGIYPDSKLLITGHSMGGTLSQISAIDVAKYIKSISGSNYLIVESFGSPRWGNKVLAEYFESWVDQHWRVTNLHDPVPHLPKMEWGGYWQTSREVWYRCLEPMTYQVCDQSGEDPRCAYQNGIKIGDHTYYMNIESKCEFQDWTPTSLSTSQCDFLPVVGKPSR